ncbi:MULTISPECIES: hypothetical protein [unclassified Micromonospora]|uniref:hypothetical protein n=1 Tax=unclassified Micromonospora TaxID=2617518 RepID=UPI000EF51E80|nr:MULTISPECIES: hypothetical protein [unclassified Micromonospora]RLP87673.1 hypothetical protein EAD89_18420 [Micromonospora sp. BL4]RLP93197.1 hypothetical protein EAD98_19605 [Micromonospora sp. CV4]
MGEEEVTVWARVRHEPDRSYAVLVDGPDGEVEVGRTSRTSDVLALARAGAARLFGVPVDRIRMGDGLDFPRPPYGRDGQWVRIAAVQDRGEPSEAEDIGRLGQAYWFGAEGAWFVTVASSGTGVHPSENLDFAPTVTDDEVAAFHAYISSSARQER